MAAPDTCNPPPRTAWAPTFPVCILAPVAAVKGHPCYAAAKSGDAYAASLLVDATADFAALGRFARHFRRCQPVVVSAHAAERDGVNAIPEALGQRIASALGWPHEDRFVQANVVGHTGADGFSRLARQARFAGQVTAGAQYVLADDFVGMGGTLANMRGLLEAGGGLCLGAIALTGQRRSATLPVSAATLAELRAKHGEQLESWWQRQFGHAFDCLTESEARYLCRTADADRVRDRIAAAKQA